MAPRDVPTKGRRLSLGAFKEGFHFQGSGDAQILLSIHNALHSSLYLNRMWIPTLAVMCVDPRKSFYCFLIPIFKEECLCPLSQKT